jgi:hypothetical protein
MLLDRAKPSIAEEEDEYRWHVLTRLREAGVLDELSEDYAVWQLAHLVGAGSRERVHDELWNNPIGWQPIGSRALIQHMHSRRVVLWFPIAAQRVRPDPSGTLATLHAAPTPDLLSACRFGLVQQAHKEGPEDDEEDPMTTAEAHAVALLMEMERGVSAVISD